MNKTNNKNLVFFKKTLVPYPISEISLKGGTVTLWRLLKYTPINYFVKAPPLSLENCPESQ